MFKEGLLSLLPQAIVDLFLFYLFSKAADFSTGFLKTFKNKNTCKSEKMRDGIVRWIAEFIALIFILGIDVLLGLNYLISGVTLGLFIYKEGVSICENLAECGVNLPPIIKDKLEIFNTLNKDKKRKMKNVINITFFYL